MGIIIVRDHHPYYFVSVFFQLLEEVIVLDGVSRCELVLDGAGGRRRMRDAFLAEIINGCICCLVQF